VDESHESDRQQTPLAARCPTCGNKELQVLSFIAAHRLADDDPQQSYTVSFVLECPCGEVFLWRNPGKGD